MTDLYGRSYSSLQSVVRRFLRSQYNKEDILSRTPQTFINFLNMTTLKNIRDIPLVRRNT